MPSWKQTRSPPPAASPTGQVPQVAELGPASTLSIALVAHSSSTCPVTEGASPAGDVVGPEPGGGRVTWTEAARERTRSRILSSVGRRSLIAFTPTLHLVWSRGHGQ
eukprot:CAMPEP_0117659166 /NCGR_PEP_ID=MMETSP0804-20121206/6279_1 /TAXON_ID=1074897 /ORGANISM="Tetraselmis astigmatica, Strain CCMP880" /LENGTH=106 /DNA_ID=CAMNT_0005465789 /DNA_START=1320 /DNA_END=1637 /DNA_ORIENTATION=-